MIVKNSHHCKLVSIALDLLFVAPNGQNATPKGSTVLKLLNYFGHCMSHEYALRHETALAKINVSAKGALPP